jgi:RNA polymerase sigma factor (sigma-70 family)
VNEDGFNSSFPETRWTMVLAVRHGGDTTVAYRALEELCRIYWSPLYGYARRLGNSREDAEDLTQGFLEHALKTDMLSTADESVGKLRNFLRKSFANYIRNVHRSATAKIRGGAVEFVRLDCLLPVELELEQSALDLATPDAVYDRLCAMALVEASLSQLEGEHERSGKAALFASFKPFLDPQAGDSKAPQEALAEKLGLTSGNVRIILSRMRKRFRVLLRLLVRDTLHNATEKEVDEELKAMRQVLVR